jgi:ribonuclease P protein component
MNKKYIVKKNEEIQNIVNNSSKVVNKYYVVYYLTNDLSFSRFCVSVSKKIGKANIRNLYKRRIKDILMKNKLDKNYDCVIILRKAILDINYDLLKKELLSILEDIK